MDLTSTPKRALLRMLAQYCSSPEEAAHLVKLASPEGACVCFAFATIPFSQASTPSRTGKSEFQAVIEDALPSFLELLEMFPSCNPPFERVLEHLPPLQPRYYSAASTPLASPALLRFALSLVEIVPVRRVVEDTTKGRMSREGVCSGWLRKLAEEQGYIVPLQSSSLSCTSCSCSSISPSPLKDNMKVPLFLKQNPAFCLPTDLSIPLIMIGPGTGVAPFIGYLLHRELLLATLSEGTKVEETWLFFGCRNKEADFIYQADMERLNQAGVLTRLVTAFSRDAEEIVYVQDKLVEHAKEIFEMMSRGGRLYICG